MTLRQFFAVVIAAITMTTADAATKNNATPVATTSNNAPKKEFVYNVGGNATKYVYNLDEQGRVASKVRYTLNSNGKWSPAMAYSVFYGETETIVTCAAWNVDNHSFTRNAQQIHLDAQKYPVAILMPE